MIFPTFFPVTCHTDFVGPGTTFVSINGFNQDGLRFIVDALKKGASTIIVQKNAELSCDMLQAINQYNVRLIRVSNTRVALAHYSAQSAEYPAKKVSIIGVTGTKGKTSTTYLLEHILRSAGVSVARITGVSNSINGFELPANLTTPQPDYLHQFFKLCVMHGVTHVVMEVAAQALTLNRVDGIIFDGIIFTNITREHFEFYKNMEDYFAAKNSIFKYVHSKTISLINGDDERCAQLRFTMPDIQTYGFKNINDITGVLITSHPHVSIACDGVTYTCPSLIGSYNGYNVLTACIMAHKFGIPSKKIECALQTFQPIPGRMERYQLPNGAICVIDYAHTPSSHKAVLSALRPLTDHLIVVFGNSGTRDVGKRPLMGCVTARIADLVILTADNPGPIDPVDIIEDISDGVELENKKKLIKEPDRKKAIQIGYQKSKKNSILVLLGKGRDEYQVIGTIKHPFSERKIVQSL